MINSPASETVVTVGQQVSVDSTATARAGVNRVDLAVNGQVVRHDSPPSGNPTTFRVLQSWTPNAEGQVTVSVVAYDVNGNSPDKAAITLQAIASDGVIPTTELGATTEPSVPTETPLPPVTTEAGCTLDSQYVADVTIPDGTIMSPGAGFVKTWRVRNSGTCDWEAGFRLIFVIGGGFAGGATLFVYNTSAKPSTTDKWNVYAKNTAGSNKSLNAYAVCLSFP